MPWWAWRSVHFGLALVASVLSVAGVVLSDRARELFGEPSYNNAYLASLALVFGWAGAVLMRYPKARFFARLLLICAVADGVGMFAEGYGFYSRPTGIIEAALVILSGGTGAALAIALVLLPQAFPDGPLRTRPWPLIFTITAITTVLLLLAMAGAHQLYVWWDSATWTAFVTFIGLGVLLGTFSLLVRWRRSSRAVRPQIRLYALLNVLASATIATFVLLEEALPSDAFGVFLVLWPIAIVVVIAVTVLQAQLYDIRIVIRRAAIYAALALLVAVLFAGVYFTALLLIAERLDRAEYRWVALAVAAAVVVLLDPLRRTLRDRLEQQLLGDRRDPLRALDRLQRQVSSTDADPDFTGVVEAVAAAVRSPNVVMLLQRDGRLEQVASAGSSAGESITVPLIHSGERLGELRICRRTPGEAFSHADARLLDRMAHETAAVVHSQRRERELTSARRQAVDAAIEERSRLGRDLHDDLAPLLAGAGLSLEALRRGIPAGTPEEQEAARLAALLRRTATDTRRLAYDLQPPEFLTDFRTALDDYLKTLSGKNVPSFQLSVELDGAPQSIRHTAYRVVLEAINNVVQHAQATHARISVVSDSETLRLEVSDDGVGLDQPYVSGIGIDSMRRRIESIGGTFMIKRATPHGTCVSAAISMRLEP